MLHGIHRRSDRTCRTWPRCMARRRYIHIVWWEFPRIGLHYWQSDHGRYRIWRGNFEITNNPTVMSLKETYSTKNRERPARLVGCRLRCTDECLFRAPWVYWEDRSTITARKHTELLLPAQNSEFRIPQPFSLPGHIYRHDFTQPLIRLVCDPIRFADVQDNSTTLRGFRLSACERSTELREAYYVFVS